MPSRPIRATVNKNGFIEVLNGAIKSNDSETLESMMPKEVYFYFIKIIILYFEYYDSYNMINVIKGFITYLLKNEHCF